MVDQLMTHSGASATPEQGQLVTLVSFASTMQVWMDTEVPPLASQTVPQVPPVWVPLSQIISVASTANMAASLTPQQLTTSATMQHQRVTDAQCKKCGRKNHPTTQCHKTVTCKQCKRKDHISRFCTMSSQQELKCTFCGRSKHSTENCKARKKAERKLKKELRAKKTSMVTSTAVSTTSAGMQPLSQAQSSLDHQETPLQATGIEERLQHLANGINPSTVSTLLPSSPALPVYASAQSGYGQGAYSTVGSTHLIPISAPGMYRHNNNQRLHASNGAPSMASGASLESHMTEISKTMLQWPKLTRRLPTLNNRMIRPW